MCLGSSHVAPIGIKVRDAMIKLAVLAMLTVSCAAASQSGPLRRVDSVPLPDSATRFDYQSVDPNTGRIYLSHMGAGKLIVFDAHTNQVIANLPGYRTVTGV